MAIGSLESVFPRTFGARTKDRTANDRKSGSACPASVAQGTAMQEFRDWDAEVSSRFERLRAKSRGEGEPSLTPRQAHALAGAWYSWFIAQHEEDPGTADEWGLWLTNTKTFA